MMKYNLLLTGVFTSLLIFSCNNQDHDFLSSIDPGSYDSTWWNRTPIRLIQTNLPETEGSMDIDAYVKSVMEASANTVLFNTGGIVANYQTKLPYQWKNPNIGTGDLVADLISKLHEKGIRYIARFDFSKLDPSIAKLKPEWLYKGTNGKPQIFNGLYSACINGGYYQEYSFEILNEAIANYDFDGIFFNMMGYTGSTYAGTNTGICQCDNCRRRFLEYSGMKLPKDYSDTGVNEYLKFQRETSEELYNRVTSFIKQQNPGLIIYNYNSIGTSWIASESGASMSPGVDDIYHATKNVKRTLGSFTNRTPLNLIMGFQAIGYRNIISSPNLLRTWWLENMLHAAPVSLVVVGTLVHYEDRAFFPIANELFAFHKKYEKLFTNVHSVSKIALIQGPATEYSGMIKLLSEEHIMYDVIIPSQLGKSGVPHQLRDYETIILDDIRNMSDEMITMIDNYVRDGGKIFVTGATSVNDAVVISENRIRLKSLGVEAEFELFPKAQATYLKVSEKDKENLGTEEFKDFSLMMMNSDFLKCTVREDGRGYLRLLPSNMYGPAEKTYYKESDITDFPGVIEYSYGKGKTVFVPWQLGSEYNIKGNYAQRALFSASLNKLLGISHSLKTDASPLIEMTHLANLNKAFEWVGMVNHSGFLGNSVREPVPVHNTTVRIIPQKSVKEVRLLRSGLIIKHKNLKDGSIECVVPEIRDFEMLLILYK
ncbi:MAG TPA: alpha-amylase family protein [Bacteroidales bacterium]|nr:alpha-amylase family protein [Bacteroidales bacterium]